MIGRRLEARRIALGILIGTFAAVGSASAQDEWIPQASLRGMSGLVVIPTADVMPTDAVRFGVSWVDKKVAHNTKDQSDNYHFFFTAGFLPRVEVSFRVTHAPDGLFKKELSTEPGTFDRGGSGRLLILTEGRKRPAVAVGIDDARGTRRFHSLYVVASKWFTNPGDLVEAQLAGGYGSDALKTEHDRVLDGVFGGGQIVYRQLVAVALDFDSETWNTIIRAHAFGHLTAQVALLDFTGPAGGVIWTQRF